MRRKREREIGHVWRRSRGNYGPKYRRARCSVWGVWVCVWVCGVCVWMGVRVGCVGVSESVSVRVSGSVNERILR